MSHFSKHVTGSTRLKTSRDKTTGEGAAAEFSAYIKGDSLIVMAIDTTASVRNLKINLPVKVKSGVHLYSTGNETENLCQTKDITIDEPTDVVVVEKPAYSLNTYIFMIDDGSAVEELTQADNDSPKTYYDLHGRQLDEPHGLCIEKTANGRTRKVMLGH
jgi:glucuronoarabinoxylan endo-1,4-beta-xylanase